MLFYIGSSVGKSIAAGQQESIDCLMRILDSRKSGLLLLYSSKRTINIVIDYFNSKGYHHQAELLTTISKKFREKKQLLKDVNTFVLISCLARNISSRRRGIIYISPTSVNRSNILYPPILLGENLTDCDLYANIISKHFIDGVPSSLKQIQLSDRFEPGGGNSTHTSYRRHKDRGIDLCFCIVDSDRKCPQEGPGDTAKFVMDVDKKSRSALCKHLVIDMYSAENLLPIEEIERQFTVGKNQQQIEEFLPAKAIRTMPSWRHLPLKRGFKGRDLKIPGARSKYWAEELGKVGIKLPCCDVPECDCSLIPSINDKTLATALLPGNVGWRSLLNKEVNPAIRADYLEIAKELRSWLCVGAPIRA